MNKKLTGLLGGVGASLVFPLLALAQGGGTIQGWFITLQGIFNALIPVMIALAFVYLIWGIVQYVIGDDEAAKTKGRDRMIYGLIGFVVIFGLWGLVEIIMTTFSLDTGGVAPPIPSI